MSEDLRRLLARLRAEQERLGASDPAPSPVALPARRLRLTVDDGGEFLVLIGETASVGHAHAGRADLPLLADLEPLHARFLLSADFHSGASWSLLAEPGAFLRVASVSGGSPAGGEPARLEHADLVELGRNASLVFRLPERASGSALLELGRGLESEGATRVLLLAPGPAGRVRIGPHAARHVPVAGLEHEVELVARRDSLSIACPGGVRGRGPAGELRSAPRVDLALPLLGRHDLAVNARPSKRLPFGLGLWPLPEVGAAGVGAEP